MSVWDDGYGISVPGRYHTTKENISEVLKGFAQTAGEQGYIIMRAKGWDYPGLRRMYLKGIAECRQKHIPVLFHVQEMTQPLGHSASGSHERYKSKERLAWEAEMDCMTKMRAWMLAEGIATEHECTEIEHKARTAVHDAKTAAWEASRKAIRIEVDDAIQFMDELAAV